MIRRGQGTNRGSNAKPPPARRATCVSRRSWRRRVCAHSSKLVLSLVGVAADTRVRANFTRPHLMTLRTPPCNDAFVVVFCCVGARNQHELYHGARLGTRVSASTPTSNHTLLCRVRTIGALPAAPLLLMCMSFQVLCCKITPANHSKTR